MGLAEQQTRRKVQWATWNYKGNGERWPQPSFKEALLQPPPGLGKKLKPFKTPKKVREVDEVLQKHWGTLSDEAKQAFTNMGLGVKKQEKEPDLKEILMMHLSELPADIKAKVEGIVQPKTPVTEQSEAARLKQSVGQLRDLTNKKQQVQAKVDSYKELYKATLNELQEIQMEIEKVQKTLKDSTDNYAKLLEDVKIETEPQDTLLGLPSFMELMGKAGVAFSQEQKEQMEKMMEESNHKKRRVTGLGLGGQCG